MSRESSLLKNTIILGIGTVLPKLASIILLPLLTGYLTKEEYGTYDLITVLVSLILPTLTLQIQQAAFRFLIEKRDDTDSVNLIISSILGFIIPVATIGSIILFFILPYGSKPLNAIVCSFYWVDCVENAMLQCARGLGDNKSYSISATICSLGQLLFALIYVLGMGLGLFGAALMLLSADVAELVFILLKTDVSKHVNYRLASWSTTKEMLGYSWPLVPNSMSMWAMRMSNRFVIVYFMGNAANGVFAVAYKIPQILILVQQTFTMAWQENASIVESDEDKDAYYSKMFSVIYNLAAGLLALLLASIPILYRLLIRGDYSEAIPHIYILCLAMFFTSMAGFLGGIYVAKKRTASIGITTIVAAVVNLLIDIVGIPFYGLYAASMAVLISYMLLCIYRMIEVKKFADIHYDLKSCLVILVILVGMILLASTGNMYMLVLNGVIAIALFAYLDGAIVIKIILKMKQKIAGK